jgi:hypothetical protein
MSIDISSPTANAPSLGNGEGDLISWEAFEKLEEEFTQELPENLYTPFQGLIKQVSMNKKMTLFTILGVTLQWNSDNVHMIYNILRLSHSSMSTTASSSDENIVKLIDILSSFNKSMLLSFCDILLVLDSGEYLNEIVHEVLFSILFI